MGKNKRIITVLLLIFLLASILTASAYRYYQRERAYCFDELAEYANSLSSKIRHDYERDQHWLSRLSKVAAQYSETRLSQQEFLSYIDNLGQFSRMEMILPDSSALLASGETVDTGLDFEKLAQAGPGISRRMTDPLDPERMILRVYMPIERNGETAAILCGVTDLAELPPYFQTERFEGRAEIYLMESETGNFLLDTLHATLGHRDDVTGKKAKSGYKAEKIREDFLASRPGTAIYFSESTGEYLYGCYAPIGVADWTVLITAPESAVFRQAREMLFSFYAVGVVLLFVLAGFFIWVLWDVRREQNVTNHQLRNIQYLLEVEKELLDAHVYPSHFCLALQKIADFSDAQTAFFGIVSEQLSVHRRLWFSRNVPGIRADANLNTLFPAICKKLLEQGSFISYSMDQFAKQHPIDGEIIRQMDIRSLMIIPVNNPEGELIGVLGVSNLRRKWENAEPLSQVCPIFSMSINHYEIHQTLVQMGQIDALTGMNNRNSYYQTLEQIKQNGCTSLACAYIDVNGLHEINNHLGHDAGDAMLQTVADALLRTFGMEQSYRLGGDEFVALCKDIPEEQVRNWAKQTREIVEKAGYALSIGVEYRSGEFELNEVISKAEETMQKDKERFYADNGGERQMRELDRRLVQTLNEKKDMETFLSVLASNFRGAYFVNEELDQIRPIFVPIYIEKMLEESGNRFSIVFPTYVKQLVKPVWQELLLEFGDSRKLADKLRKSEAELIYQCIDGRWMHLKVTIPYKGSKDSRETLWIFTDIHEPMGEEAGRN